MTIDILEKNIFEEMDKEICSMTLEKYREIEREVAIEVEDTRRRMRSFKAEEYYGR
jgi:hypothetical protein